MIQITQSVAQLIKYEFGDDFTGNDVVDEVEVTQIRL